MTITIQGHEFDFGQPRYAEGHSVNANEAHALNQVLLENVRNNTASRIKAAAEKAAVAPADVNIDSPNEAGLTLRQSILDYAASYAFGLRSVRTAEPVDPVEKEAIKIAKDAIRKALASKKIKVANLPEGKFDEMVETYAAREDTVSEAKRRVKANEKAGAGELDLAAFGIELPTEDTPSS